MLLLLLNYVVLRALWKIDVHLISILVNKSLYYMTDPLNIIVWRFRFMITRLCDLVQLSIYSTWGIVSEILCVYEVQMNMSVVWFCPPLTTLL